MRCVDAPADSLRCVALEMPRGGGEKQEGVEEEEEEREAGCGIPPRLRSDANLTPRKVTPPRIGFSIARVFSDFPATFPKLLTSVAAFYILLNILFFYSPGIKYKSWRYSNLLLYISSGANVMGRI